MKENASTKVKKISLFYILPSLFIIGFSSAIIYLIVQLIFQDERTVGFSFEDNYAAIGNFFNGITTPILTLATALFALWAFLSQQEQLKLQKEESNRQRIEGTFFHLFDLHTNMVRELEYEMPYGKENYIGRAFFKKAYTDLINIYLQEDGMEDVRLHAAMKKLDKIHANNFHLYYKNLFQLFYWIYEHREVLSEKQKDSYIALIRAQLSHYEMMLVYFNAKFFGRNFFYKMLDELTFLSKYNLDGHGSVEEKFRAEAEAFKIQSKARNNDAVDYTPITFSRDELFQALQQNEVNLYFQPIVQSASKKIIQVEALLRWTHPEKGKVRPEDFVHQVEHYGLTDELFDYLMHHICAHMKQFKLKIVYSINISLEQLLLTGLPERVENICKEHKVSPKQLQFEITESKELYLREQIKQIITSLREKGFRVGLDDFGSGYFSFRDLMELPVVFLKLDKQFVSSLTEQSHQESVIRNIIEIAKLQGWNVTAEGIETAEQLATWRNLEVDALQGYYISEPVPYDQVKKLFRKKAVLK